MVTIELSRSSLTELAADVVNAAADVTNRGTVAPHGQPLDLAVSTTGCN